LITKSIPNRVSVGGVTDIEFLYFFLVRDVEWVHLLLVYGMNFVEIGSCFLLYTNTYFRFSEEGNCWVEGDYSLEFQIFFSDDANYW